VLLGASVDPAQVTRDSTLDLLIHYRIDGAATPAQVSEVRRLLQGDKVLATFSGAVQRTSGTFTSSQKIKVPGNIAPGVYSFVAEVEAGGVRDEAKALFEIR
jgi:hypothetical protein